MKRTPEQIAYIKARWAERKDTFDKITRMSNNVLKVAKEYPEINVTDLRNYIDMYSIYKMDKEARIVAKKIVEI